jgi:hypothetical protein
VQGQLAGILASGNPLLVQAQTRARQQAQQRGLLNTSMGVQAGEEALYGAALPIAQGDVDVYNRQAFTNAELAQQAELANQQARNQMEQLNVQESGVTGRFNVEAAQQAELANQQARNQMEQLNVQESGVTGRFNVEAAQRAELANQQARNEMERLNVQEAGTTGRFNVEAAQRAELENQQARNQMAQLNLQEAGTTSRFAAGEAGATGRFNVEAAQRTELENAQMQQQTAIENARLQQQAATQQGENQMRLMLQQMDATTRTDLVNIEANYRTLMQASASASDLYQQTLRNISDITANKDMNAEAKNASISQQKELLQNGMNLIGSMNNIGVSQLLDFSAGGASGVTAAPVDEMRTTQPVPDRYTGLSLYDTARG